jgi:fused signal recognition particle receptor
LTGGDKTESPKTPELGPEEPIAEEPIAEEPVIEEPLAAESQLETEAALKEAVAEPSLAPELTPDLSPSATIAPEPTPVAPTRSPVLPAAELEAPPEPTLIAEPTKGVEPLAKVEEKPLEQLADAIEAKPEDKPEAQPEEEIEAQPEEKPKLGFLARLKQKLINTRDRITGRIEKVLIATKEIDENVLEELEEILITSDLGVKTTEDLLYKIRGQVSRKELKDAAALKEALRARLLEIIDLPSNPVPSVKPLVIMMVGVNGVGKTTTIAKLAKRYRDEGKSVLLAAGDTFRAAAVEQLAIWAKRVDADLVSQPTGADPSAVVFDALTAAKARGVDVVIIDTAGRLHTKVNLMEELKKIRRVANKALPGAPHKTILILDANTGQNATNQARTFHEAVELDSLIITKLDGTSKGGVVVSIINELKLPVTFIGLGETYDDLRPFSAVDFAEAILGSGERV